MSVTAWSVLLLALAFLLTERWRVVRRRTALNRALHEIRRPLQALALLTPATPSMAGAGPGRRVIRPAADRVTDPVLQAISALKELDHELNGGPGPGQRCEPVACRLLADGCVRRWQSRAGLSDASLRLFWSGPDVLVMGDGVALAAALENLIVNAIEHGGPEIAVTGRAVGHRVRIEVCDNGREARQPDRCDSPAEVLARLRGRSIHGHGLAVASETVADHGGRLETDFGDTGSAVIVLPTAVRRSGATPVRVNW